MTIFQELTSTKLPPSSDSFFLIGEYCMSSLITASIEILEDVSINNEYEYENDFKPYSYSKSFSQLSMLAMTPSSSL